MKRCVFTLLALLCSAILWQGEALAARSTKKAPNPSGMERVVVLPFQINGGSDVTSLNSELPALFVQSFRSRGLEVVPYKDTLDLLRRQKISQPTLANARTLALQTSATFAVYGSFNQMGNAFSIDARLVNASGQKASRPFFLEKKSLLELQSAVSELTGLMSGDMVHTSGIADIKIRGLRVLDPDVVLMRLSTRKGDNLDEAAINEEIKRVWDLGYFSDVAADIEKAPEGLLLVFTVKEKPRIDDVLVNGSDAVKKEDILTAMSSKTGSVVSEKLLAGDIQKITELYRKEGFYLAEVAYTIEPKANSASAVLVLNVKEGKKLYIKEIKFEGLETIDPGDLKKELVLQEHGILSWFTGSGVLREEFRERDAAAITAYAMNHGYIDIQVAEPNVAYGEDGIVITFRINEGPRYKIGEVGFVGDLIDTDERLNEIIKLDDLKNSSGYFDLSVVHSDMNILKEHYANYGYAFAEVKLDNRKKDDETIDIFFTIFKDKKMHVRRVVTEGNTRTRDNVILRELRLADGDTFDGSKFRRSNERLNRLRYFQQADIEVVRVSEQGDEVDLRVNVKEDRTGAVMGGVGYSTFYQFGVSGSIMERNLFGRGYQLGLNGFVSGKASTLDLGFVNPRLFDTDFGFSNDTYARWEEWDDFRKKTIGDTLRVFHPVGEYSSVSLGYRFDRYTLFDIPDSASHAYRQYEGRNLSSVVSAGFGYDSTDSRERPTRGVAGRLFMEYGGGGIGGNDDFFKPVIEAQAYHTLFKNPNHVFHWRSRAGATFENSSKPVPVFDRFFIGGMDSIRGYDSEDLAPRDPVWHDEIGGDRMGFVNLEYIWTFHEAMGLALVPFFDAGFNVDSKQTSDPFSQIKKSVGLELRWRSPMGDLRFAYGYALDENVKGDRPGGRFEFSMGQFF